MRLADWRGLLLGVFLLLGLCQCALLQRGADDVLPEGVVETQEGLASLYTWRSTASGEPFRAKALCAAHRHWPMGTRVRVVSQKTGRSVVVRINDRGPFVRGRVIDLTPAAAAVIGLTWAQGLTRVRLERLAAPSAGATSQP
jgi:rare lipoprotein A (peptidoglycan hydrolase)